MKTKNFFVDTEILRHGNFTICTTMPDLGTTHPLPWVGCEKNLETLELVVLMLYMLYKVVLKTVHKHQPTNKNLSFASCLKKFSGFDFVKNKLLGLVGGFLHT